MTRFAILALGEITAGYRDVQSGIGDKMAKSAIALAANIDTQKVEEEMKEIVLLEGVPVRGVPKEHPSFCVAEPEKIRECKEKGIEMLSRESLPEWPVAS